MTSWDLLDIIGEAEDKYILDVRKNPVRRRKHVPLKRYLLIAAILTFMLFLVGFVAAIIKLQEMKVGVWVYTYPDFVSEMGGQTVTSDVISMQGFVDSKNYQAAKEWRAFTDNYDTDGTLLKKADADGFHPAIEYMPYNAYTQEMVEKLDEICAKYGLELLGPVYLADSAEEIFSAVGIESIVTNSADAEFDLWAGYYYRGGSFFVSGDTRLVYEGNPWVYPVSYQYRCVMKNAFDDVVLSVGDVKEYEEWNYTMQDGTEVLLALSRDKAVIIADKEEYFVTINIMNPSVGDVIYGELCMDRAALEAIAETFTFAYVPQSPDPSGLVEPEWFETAEYTE